MLLYAITERRLFTGDEDRRLAAMMDLVRGWVRGGVDFIQIREKDLGPEELFLLSQKLVAAVRYEQARTRILLNGPASIALEAGADGVHLPGNASIGAAAAARELFAAAGRTAVISRACHSAADAAEGGADLLLYAPVFEKAAPGEAIPGQGLAALAKACRRAENIPVLALGGVTAENARACIEAGASGVAAIRLFLGPEWQKLRQDSL